MTASVPVKPGSDLRDDFRRAYENRYTWAPGFSGYRGRCIWQQGDQRVEGTFEIGADLKAKVDGIENEEILKAVNSQLWEVAIHRVRRSFQQTHGETPSPPVAPTRWEPKCSSVARGQETSTASRMTW